MTRTAASPSELLGAGLPSIPRRVVSLCPSITETLFAMGAGERVAGATRFCVHPEARLGQVPKIGGTKDPDLDAIRALAPDLILANREENRREDVLALAAGFPVHLSHPRSPTDVPPLIREWGDLLDCRGEAEGLACEVEKGISSLREAAASARFRFAYLVWRSPWMAAGRGTYIDGLASLGGGKNVFPRDRGDYPATGIAELVELDPDVVLLPDEPFPFSEKHAVELREGGIEAPIMLVSGEAWCWHGARTVQGLAAAEELAQSI